MIVVEHFFWRRKRNIQRVTEVDKVLLWQALVIGIAQSLAMWPGTSRSMITMLAGLVVGLDMIAAAEFSFLLALPTLSAATFLSAYEDWGILKATAGINGIIVGLVVSGVVAAIAVKAFVKWLTHHGLKPFGVYRIIAAIVLLWVLTNK
jgi:undecaprenyl-diphosphatase